MRRLGVIAALCAAMALPAGASAITEGDRHTLREQGEATWRSFVAMTDRQTGLPADILHADGTTDPHTSTTNIGAYMWSAVGAERLGIIGHRELARRMRATLTTLEDMERHQPSGQFYNWYDHTTGEKLTVWPPSGEPLTPILSSVDNGWFATGLRIVASSVPEVADRARAIYDGMDFGFYYRPEVNRILFHYVPDTGAEACCYDTVVSESRIATYLGMANGEVPGTAYFGTWRSFPDTCDGAGQETKPIGRWRNYLGVPVFEGAYEYGGMLVTPSWGGSMFEALMPALFVPEERWGERSWGINHPVTAAAQIHHGLEEAGYGYWGFSPANVPEGGYRTWGVDGIGMDRNGYPSNEDDTLIDRGFPGCPDREPQPDPPQSAYTNGVVTPHAAFLALRYAPAETLANLRRLADDFPGLYTDWGFRDSVNVQTGAVSATYLALDQGMIMAAIANELGDDVLRRAFVARDLERAVRPLLAIERFGASR